MLKAELSDLNVLQFLVIDVLTKCVQGKMRGSIHFHPNLFESKKSDKARVRVVKQEPEPHAIGNANG